MRKSTSLPLFVARLLFLASALAALGWTSIAHAQGAGGDRVQNEVFDDDLLQADLGAPFGARVFPSHLPPPRTLLIRPRTNFLPELYQSVEQL
ncbi:MAG TPA: hypothetical protein VER12_04100 [Polyangiaceae bacterium]|nr:hypothetical protein [Polyangiaceae bacterium]